MLEEKKCELCKKVIAETRAQFKQTKYHLDCARMKKKESSVDPIRREDGRKYMRHFMRAYRAKHKGLSTPYVRQHRARKRRALRTSVEDVQKGFHR
jgi:hypothetical protein